MAGGLDGETVGVISNGVKVWVLLSVSKLEKLDEGLVSADDMWVLVVNGG